MLPSSFNHDFSLLFRCYQREQFQAHSHRDTSPSHLFRTCSQSPGKGVFVCQNASKCCISAADQEGADTKTRDFCTDFVRVLSALLLPFFLLVSAPTLLLLCSYFAPIIPAVFCHHFAPILPPFFFGWFCSELATIFLFLRFLRPFCAHFAPIFFDGFLR